MLDSTGIYVLFGDKPMCLDEFIRTDRIWKEYMYFFTNLYCGLDHCKYQRGWQVWEKYKHLFPLKKFILVQQEIYDFVGHTTVSFVHKKNFLKVMDMYSQDFKKILGENFNPNDIIDCFANSKCILHKKIKRHSALLGMFLGYGRDNAWYFYNLSRLRKQSHKSAEAQKEFLRVQAQFIPFVTSRSNWNPDFGCLINLPMFMCDPNSEETRDLRQKYVKQRREIYKAYQKGDFLEITLLKLTEE